MSDIRLSNLCDKSDKDVEPLLISGDRIDDTDECVIIPRESWFRLLAIVRQPDYPEQMVFSNQDVKEILHVSDALIRKYRESGDLPFSSDGDKIWYTIHDIHAFLKINHYN